MLRNPNLWTVTSLSGQSVYDSPPDAWDGTNYSDFRNGRAMYASAASGGRIHGAFNVDNTSNTPRLIIAIRTAAPGNTQWDFDEILYSADGYGPHVVDIEVPAAPGTWVVIGVGSSWTPSGFESYGYIDSIILPPPLLIANDDEATTPHNTPVIVSVLDNDTLDDSLVTPDDLEGPPGIVTPPSIGSVVVNPDGSITYAPPEGFTGEVEFEYMIERKRPEVCSEIFMSPYDLKRIHTWDIEPFPDWLGYDDGASFTLNWGSGSGTWRKVDATNYYEVDHYSSPSPPPCSETSATLTQGENSVCANVYVGCPS